MAGERIIDTLVTRYAFRSDTRGLDGLENRIDRIRGRLNNASTTFTVAGTVLTGALFGVQRTIVDFETEMNNLQAVLNASEDDMSSLREQAMELGRTTAFSASQAAAAQTELAKAGFEVEEVIAALPGVLDLAAAGNLGLEEAAAITTATLASFKLPAEDAGMVADLLAKAAASAKTDVSAMGVAFREAAPLAAQLGVPIEDVAAMLATLQDNGLRASTAGVGVRNMMVRLLNPTKEVSDTLQGMGIRYDEVTDLLNQGRLADIIQLLADKNLTAADATKLFGAESANAALILTGNTERVDELTESLANAEGEAKRMAETQMQGLPGALKEFKSAVEGAILAIGEAGLTKALEDSVDQARALVTWFTNLDESTLKLVGQVLLLGPALVAGGVALKGLSVALGGVVPLLRTMRWLVVGMAGPFGIMAAAVAAAAVLIYNNWEGVVSFFEGVWEGIENAFPDTAAWFRGLWDAAATPREGIFNWVTDAWDSAVAWISGPQEGQNQFDWLMQPVEGLFDWTKDAWDSALVLLSDPASITNAMQSVRDMMKNTVGSIDFAAIGGDVGTAIATLPGILAAMVATVNGIDFASVGTTIGDFIGPVLVAGVAGLTGILAKMTTAAAGIDFASVGETIGNFIVGRLVSTVALLTGLLGSLTTTVEEIDWGKIGKIIGRALRVAVIGRFEALPGLLNAMDRAVSALDWDVIGRTIGKAVRVAFLAYIKLVYHLWKAVLTGVAETDWASIGVDIALALMRGIGAIFKGLGDFMLGLITEAFAGIDWLGFLPEWAQNWLTDDEGGGLDAATINVAGARGRPQTLDERLAQQERAAQVVLAAPSRPGGRAPINQNRATNLEVGTINVNVPSGDPEVIASTIQSALDDNLRNTAEDYDSGINR